MATLIYGTRNSKFIKGLPQKQLVFLLLNTVKIKNIVQVTHHINMVLLPKGCKKIYILPYMAQELFL